jgi:hypothetical protein
MEDGGAATWNGRRTTTAHISKPNIDQGEMDRRRNMEHEVEQGDAME